MKPRHRMRRAGAPLLALVLFLGTARFVMGQQDDPSEIFLKAYLSAQQGERLEHESQFKTALANLGQELDYMDQPEFAKFWEADAQRIEAAIREIGRVQG